MGSKKKGRNQNKARANKVVETNKKVDEPTETHITPSAIKLTETEEQTDKQKEDQNGTILQSPTIQASLAKPSIPSPDNIEVVKVENQNKFYLFENSKKEILKEQVPEVNHPVENLPEEKPSLKNFPESKEANPPLKDVPEVKDPVQKPPEVKPPLKNVPEVKPPIASLLPEIKHPLENTWGFWLYTNENKKNWTENQKKLTMFDTVEDYWCLYHHIKLPSELKVGQDYAVFKSGISPMWEDPANEKGGRWLINMDHRDRGMDMDRVWLDVVLLMIGENFQNSDMICGAVVNVRQRKRVSVWTRNKDEAANMEIGIKLKNVLRITNKLQFLDHVKNAELFYV